MPIWRIYPVAHPKDSRWQKRRIWAEVDVQASSAAFARIIAAGLDEAPQAHWLGNESHCFRSGFEDGKLYWVRRLNSDEMAQYKAVPRQGGVVGTSDPLRVCNA